MLKSHGLGKYSVLELELREEVWDEVIKAEGQVRVQLVKYIWKSLCRSSYP